MEREVLYVGADDSNNHDVNQPIILATTFSLLNRDSIYRGFSRERVHEDFFYWLGGEQQERDFRFGLLKDPSFRAMQPLLPLAVPDLVLNYAPTLRETPKKIWVCLDGILPKSHKDYIRDRLRPYFSEVVVNNVVKRRNSMAKRPLAKRLECPTILKMADTCANQIYGFPSREGLPERVLLDPSRLKREYLRLRAS